MCDVTKDRFIKPGILLLSGIRFICIIQQIFVRALYCKVPSLRPLFYFMHNMRYIRRKCAQQNLFEIRHKLETQILSLCLFPCLPLLDLPRLCDDHYYT